MMMYILCMKIEYDKETHKRLKLISVKVNKKLYELIMESVFSFRRKIS